MANKTVSDIYGYANDILRQEGSGSGIPGIEEDRALEWVNDLNAAFFEEFYENGIVLPDYMASNVGYDAVQATALSAATAANATSMTVESSSALDTSGAFVILDNQQWDIATHTGNSGGSVSGIPSSGRDALNFAHDSGNTVQKLYALPTDFGKMRPQKRYDLIDRAHEGVTVDGRGYRQVPNMPEHYDFSVHETASGSKYLWLPRSHNGQIMVHYDRKPTTLDAVTDTVDMPSPHHWWLVWGLVALFKQVMEESYVPQYERSEQAKVMRSALKKDSAGKRLTAGIRFFNRYRHNA